MKTTLEKEKLPDGEQEKLRLRSHIHVLRGLINYHERMTLPISLGSLSCTKNGSCPAVAFENDVYLAALKESLRLMERELGEGESKC